MNKKRLLIFGIPILIATSSTGVYALTRNESVPTKVIHSTQVKDKKVEDQQTPTPTQTAEAPQSNETDTVPSSPAKPVTQPQNVSQDPYASCPELEFIHNQRSMPDVGTCVGSVEEYKESLISVGYQFLRFGNPGSIIIYSDSIGIVQSFDGTSYQVLTTDGTTVTVSPAAGIVFIP